jgi:hypothetical protein
MSTLREAAQQALEALEFMADEWGFTQKANRPERWQAIEALRAALAQQDEPKGGGNLPPPLQAEPVQEPVLVVEKEPDYMSRGHFYEGSKPFIDPTLVWKLPIGTKLYAQPPRREWEGLSEEDMEDLLPLYSDPSANTEMLEFAAAIEVKLKEKNA